MSIELTPAEGAAPDLSEIARTSREYHRLASEVNERLEAFTNWLNDLPGKTEVTVSREHEESGRTAYLKLARGRTGWHLVYAASNSLEVNLVPLDSVSLPDKCLAILMLPDLLHQFYTVQRSTVDRLKEASAIFAQLPTAKGGK